MSTNPVNIGSNTGTAVSSLAVTVGAAGTPKGTQLLVAFAYTGTLSTVVDSKSNSYLFVGNDGNTGITVALYRARGATVALVNGDTITLNFTGPCNAAMNAFYIDGLANVVPDSNVTNGGGGTSSTPSITSSGPAAGAGELFIGLVGAVTSTTYTQDSTNAPWASPPGVVSTGAPVFGGGVYVAPGTGAVTYAPTLGVSSVWAAMIVALIPDATSGWQPQAPRQLKSPLLRSQRVSATRGKAEFAIFPNLLPAGRQRTPEQPQPPHRRIERAGAIMRGDDGIQAGLTPWISAGRQRTPEQPQPPHRRIERTAAFLYGDHGIGAQKINFVNAPDNQIVPLLHPRPEQRSAVIQWSFNIDAVFVPPPLPAFTENQIVPIPMRKGRTPEKGDDGNQFPFVNWRNSGWELQTVQPPHPRPERAAGIIPVINIEALLQSFYPYGWEVQQPQPPHPRPERSVAVLRSDDGNQSPFVAWRNGGWELQSIQPPHPRFERFGSVAKGNEGTEAQFVNWRNGGWEVHITQPPHLRPERIAAILRGDDGIEAKFVFAPSTVPLFGWEVQSFQPSTFPTVRQRGFGARGESGFALIPNLLPVGWEIQPPQPPHPRPERIAATLRGDDGIQTKLINWIYHGWPIQSVQPPHPRPERSSSWLLGDPGIQATYAPTIPLKNWGWETQPTPLKIYPRIEQRSFGAHGESGFALVPNLLPVGWEVQPVQPPHRKVERAGFLPWHETGTEGKYIFVPLPPPNWGWEIQSLQPPIFPKVQQRGFGVHGESGFALVPNLLPMGWEVQPFQPPHRRVERAGFLPWHESGTEAKYIFVPPPTPKWVFEWSTDLRRTLVNKSGLGGRNQFVPFNLLPYGWEIRPVQPPHPRPERAAAILHGDDGTEAKFVFVPPAVLYFGWEVMPTLHPHPRPERSGAVLKGNDGIDSTLIRFFPAGWEVPSFQPFHIRWERVGAVLKGDEGNQSPFVRWFNVGWEIQPPQPPHPRSERSASIMTGDPGNEFPFIFVVVPKTVGWEFTPPLTVHPRPEHSGSLAKGDDGNQTSLVTWSNVGYEIQPVQPPHRSPELKHGAVARGDDGTASTFVNWRNTGWEIQSVQPPHRSPELKHGSIARGDDGTQSSFIRWLNAGWEIAPVLPPHPRPERIGSFLVGDQGTEAPFIPPVFTPWGYEFFWIPARRLHLDAILRNEDVLYPFQVFANVYKSVTIISSTTSKSKVAAASSKIVIIEPRRFM